MRWVVLLLVALHKASADDVSCETQLDDMKKQLAKTQAATTDSTLLVETPQEYGKPHFPEASSAYVPPLSVYKTELKEWMKTTPFQWVVAIVAGAFGMLCVLNGPA